jgi:hypothetical protein
MLYNPNGWADSLRFNYYRTPALIAPMDWIDTTAPQHPHITKVNVGEDKGIQQFTVSGDGINNNETETIKNFVVYLSQTIIGLTDHPAGYHSCRASVEFEFLLQSSLIPLNGRAVMLPVTSVDRENNESQASNVFLLEKKQQCMGSKKIILFSCSICF